MKKILIAVLFLLASAAYAGPFFPVGGNDNDIIVKTGDSDPQNDMHFDAINPGRHSELLAVGDDKHTTYIKKDQLAAATHQHVVQDLMPDILKYKIPTCIQSQQCTVCDSADISTQCDIAEACNTATNAKACGASTACVNADTCDNGLPQTGEIKQRSKMLFYGGKFQPRQAETVPTPSIANGILIVKTNPVWTDSKTLIADSVQVLKKNRAWILAYYIAFGCLTLLWFVIITLVYIWRKPGTRDGDVIKIKFDGRPEKDGSYSVLKWDYNAQILYLLRKTS